jgi:hypothetical protein
MITGDKAVIITAYGTEIALSVASLAIGVPVLCGSVVLTWNAIRGIGTISVMRAAAPLILTAAGVGGGLMYSHAEWLSKHTGIPAPILRKGGFAIQVVALLSMLKAAKYPEMTGPQFRAEADLLQPRLGPARLSNPEEYQAIMNDLQTSGVEIIEDANSLSYGPSIRPGEPGQIKLDPDASIGALRHEYTHFLQDRASGYAGWRYWFTDKRLTARMEARAYYQEIITARETGNADLVPKIVAQMRARVAKVLTEENGQ